MVWAWERTNAGTPGMSGDLAKIFRHEPPKTPGVFAADAPPAAATLLAREVVQNSWDAARDLRRTDSIVPQFGIEFRFQDVAGEGKHSLVRSLGLGELAARLSGLDRARVGLGPTDCLDSLDTEEPLRVLRITESAASGMYGPWEQNRSHMYLALLSIGFTEKFSGAGGSYGYGKAGLINGSRIRSIVAYTCFREQENEPEVTRRLLGVTYWGPHDHSGSNHPGIATFSGGSAGAIRPFENEEADDVARNLGIALRTPGRAEDLGTTFLLIDTPIVARELVRAIERSWWPAILEDDFVATVIGPDGSTLRPRPMQDPVLHTFFEAWEIATGRSSPGPDAWYARLTGPASPVIDDDPMFPYVGTIGLVADLSDWSYSDQVVGPEGEEVSHRSLVALTRGPKMVVEYLEAGRAQPHIRGVFIADPAINDLLRLTEPKTHDSWRAKAEPGEVAPDAAAIAKHAIQRIKQTVSNHRNRLRPPTPPPDDVNLPFFNDIMRKVMSGMGRGVRQPVSDTRPITIRLEHELRLARSAGLIELSGSAVFGLSEHFQGDAAAVTISIAYRFIEDERVGEHVALRITSPDEFSRVTDGVFAGVLERGQESRFEFVSAPYDPVWSGRLIANGELRSTQADSGAAA
jgi:hypothetical protein